MTSMAAEALGILRDFTYSCPSCIDHPAVRGRHSDQCIQLKDFQKRLGNLSEPEMAGIPIWKETAKEKPVMSEEVLSYWIDAWGATEVYVAYRSAGDCYNHKGKKGQCWNIGTPDGYTCMGEEEPEFWLPIPVLTPDGSVP